jgi:hypothetical protein
MSVRERCWNGQEKLWRVFWIYGFGLFFLLAIAAMRVPPLVGLLFVQGAWMLVALWRCAFNSDYRVLGYLVRAGVIAFPVSIAALLWMVVGSNT